MLPHKIIVKKIPNREKSVWKNRKKSKNTKKRNIKNIFRLPVPKCVKKIGTCNISIEFAVGSGV